MDYVDFSVEELASDERFINWVKNECSPAESDFWQLLALSHPNLQEKIDRARILVINVYRADHAEEIIDPIDDEAVHEIWRNVLVGIEDAEKATGKTIELIPHPHKKFFSQKRRRTLVFAVAASVALLFSTIFLIKKEQTPPLEWYSYRQKTPGFIEYSNTTQKSVELVTMDGSIISLEPNSSIKYKRNYEADTIRKVYLQGEAFFDVARNPLKPFVVFTNDVATEVLGTSFHVTGDAATKNVVVKVKTGKVSVYSVKRQSVRLNDPKEGVILLPNQEVTYTDEIGLFEKKIVDAPELVKGTSAYSFIFEDTPITGVFEKLEEAYGVEILFDRETMKNCFLTVPLGSEPLFDKLKVICRTIGASYEIIDAKVVITSAGCKTVDPNKTKE